MQEPVDLTLLTVKVRFIGASLKRDHDTLLVFKNGYRPSAYNAFSCPLQSQLAVLLAEELGGCLGSFAGLMPHPVSRRIAGLLACRLVQACAAPVPVRTGATAAGARRLRRKSLRRQERQPRSAQGQGPGRRVAKPNRVAMLVKMHNPRHSPLCAAPRESIRLLPEALDRPWRVNKDGELLGF